MLINRYVPRGTAIITIMVIMWNSVMSLTILLHKVYKFMAGMYNELQIKQQKCLNRFGAQIQKRIDL